MPTPGADYLDFLANKQVRAADAGFQPAARPGWLHDWQGWVSGRSIEKGRSAVFAGCGLGKTRMEFRVADEVRRHADKPVLLLTPLAVGSQMVREAKNIGLDGVKLCESQADVTRHTIAVTNYQKILAGHFDPPAFGGVVLDESSILKSYTGKTKKLLVEAFANTPYKLCATATPSPNDLMELGNHAEFLGIMPANEMLSRWFINDQSKTGAYRLKRHAERDYWRWVASWAVCLDRPSDLGYPDGGYDLPPITYHQHVTASRLELASGELFASSKLNATSMHKEMRRTAQERAAVVADLVMRDEQPWVIWCNTNYESEAIMELLAARPVQAVEVRGNQSDAVKERHLDAFASGQARVIVSKPSICGFGLNWQHCRRVAFLGLSFSHEQFYQAVRRAWRFGQTKPVEVHVVIADSEGEVLASIQRKEEQAERMRREMIRATAEGNDMGRLSLRQTETAVRVADRWVMQMGDCVEQAKTMDPDSVDLTVFSPPFAGLYIYSDGMADMGNAADDSEFFRHYGYLAPELLRITVPGRLCAVHCKDLPKYANRDGTAGLKDFPGELIRVMEGAGWSYHSRVTIWKCPVVERERTNTNGLLHKTLKRDSSQVRQGMADYLLVFRRPPAEGLMSAKPIERPDGLDEYRGDTDPRQYRTLHPASGSRSPSQDEALALWQRYAEPVWWDIDQMDTLNEAAARESQDEKHICPLQLGLIRRVVQLWSLPGEVVFSPFAGIGSEGYVALQEGRRFVGVELKRSYWERACLNLAAVAAQPMLPGMEAA